MQKEIALGVNIDHVATLRNARREGDPSLLEMAFEVQEGGADSITMHLREDRRHILDEDLFEIQKHLKIPINLEMAPTEEMLKIALDLKPRSVCIVPERREEITTEGGLDVKKYKELLIEFQKELIQKEIEVFLFVEPDIEALEISKEIGVKGIEVHTGSYARSFKNNFQKEKELKRIYEAAKKAKDLGLEFHAGHGLNRFNLIPLLKIPNLKEVNIGHSIIARALKIGLKEAVREIATLLTRKDKG